MRRPRRSRRAKAALPAGRDRIRLDAQAARRCGATRFLRAELILLPVATLLLSLAACGEDETPIAPDPAAPRVVEVRLTPAIDTLSALGDTVRLAASAVAANGRHVPDAGFTWESSDTRVAIIDRAGAARATGAGTATITATTGSISGTAELIVPGPAPFDATPPPPDPTPVSAEVNACRGWEEWFVGDYMVFNNVWNRLDTRDYQQCIMRRALPELAERIEYGWRWSWPMRRGQVKSYPEVMYGHKPWHSSSTTSELPRQIGSLAALEVDYEAYLTADGIYNLAFDFWITSDNPPTPAGITHEVMIWLDNGFRPAGLEFYVGPVRLDGALWDLYIWPERVWRNAQGEQTLFGDFIALVRHRDQHVGSIDLLAFFRYLVDEGHLPAHHYLTAIEFGNEVVSGSGELWLKDFRVRLR